MKDTNRERDEDRKEQRRQIFNTKKATKKQSRSDDDSFASEKVSKDFKRKRLDLEEEEWEEWEQYYNR